MFEKIKSFLFKNTSTRQTVAKNSIWLSISNFGGRLLKAIIIIYAARVLGTAAYGVFSYALTLAGFLTLFMDPGINAVLMRDTAGATDDVRRKVFSTAFVIKLFLLAFGMLIVIFIAPYFTLLPGAQALLPIVAAILMFDTLREFFSSLIRGMEKMEWEAAIFIFTNVAIVGLGFLFLSFRPTVKSLGWGYALGTALGAFAAIILLWDYSKRIFSSFSKKLAAPILRTAWPFAVTSALGLLLTNTDILIISWLGTASDVGIYSAGIRIIQILYLIPTVLQFSVLPLFSRLARKDDEKFRRTLERIVGVTFLASVPLAVGGILLGTQVMEFIYGAPYAPAGLSFKILMATMIVDFPALIIGNAIFTYGRQKSLIITSLIGGVTNVVLDLILIPPFGIAGSAAATLIAQALSNSYLWNSMNKLNPFSVIPRLKKVALAAAAMGIVIFVLLTLHVPVLLNVIVGVVVYFLLLKVLHESLLEETLATVLPSAATSAPAGE